MKHPWAGENLGLKIIDMTKLLEMCSRIIAILLYSNEIEIGGPLFSKIHQMGLGTV